MKNEIFDRLADWLSTTYRALPGIKTPEFTELLQFLYTPEEADLALAMGPEGETLDILASRTGIGRERGRGSGQHAVIIMDIRQVTPENGPIWAFLEVKCETSGLHI